MLIKIFKVWVKNEYTKAGFSDIIELKPNKGGNHLYFQKWILEIIVHAICTGEYIHISGPSGSAKSALLEALMIEENFSPIAKALGFATKPLIIYPIEMATYETPGEFQFRRSLNNGTTFDEKSDLIVALEQAQALRKNNYIMIWLREMGRVHSSTVQGGLLNLMTKAEILLRDHQKLSGNDICWVADSNYQAEGDSHFSLVPLDTALKRRFSVNVTIDYLDPEMEMKILEFIIDRDTNLKQNPDLIKEVVRLGNLIRQNRLQGNLLSVPPPTIYGYLTYYKMATSLTHLSKQMIAKVTLLGHANTQDQKFIPSIFNEIYSFNFENDDKETLASNLF